MSDTAGRRGSVRRDPARGTWTVVVDASDIGAATRRQVRRRGFRTERDAQRALTEVLAELDHGTYVAPDLPTTLADYVEGTWLPALRVRRRRPSTLESYRRNLEIHVLPRLGRRPLCKVLTADLDRLYADLLAGADGRRALAPRSVRYIHTILHGVFGHAVMKGYLGANPCQRADAPEPKACRSREMTTWSPAQLRLFLESLDGDRFRGPLFLLATTGMRRGEVLGLRWSDLRFDDGELDVRRTLGSVDNELVVTEPKTASGRRTVSLDASAVLVLRQHRADQLRERLAARRWLPRPGLGVRAAGRRSAAPHPVSPGVRPPGGRARSAADPAARPAAHLGEPGPAGGVNPKIVQERIGHASVAITLDLYTHTDRAQHTAAAEAVTRPFWADAR